MCVCVCVCVCVCMCVETSCCHAVQNHSSSLILQFTELPPSDLNPCYFIHTGHFSVHCSAVTVAKLIIQNMQHCKVCCWFSHKLCKMYYGGVHRSTKTHHLTGRSTHQICFMTTVYTTWFMMWVWNLVSLRTAGHWEKCAEDYYRSMPPKWLKTSSSACTKQLSSSHSPLYSSLLCNDDEWWGEQVHITGPSQPNRALGPTYVEYVFLWSHQYHWHNALLRLPVHTCVHFTHYLFCFFV